VVSVDEVARRPGIPRRPCTVALRGKEITEQSRRQAPARLVESVLAWLYDLD
jgi:hypothetical protein